MGFINSAEKNFLFENKIKEGKSEFRAGLEVRRDVEYEKSLYQNLRELKQELKILAKENSILKKEKQKIFLENLKLMRKSPIEKPKEIEDASIKNCNRILACLENNEMRKNKIRKESGLKNGILNIVLNFLERNNLIKKEMKGRWFVYSRG